MGGKRSDQYEIDPGEAGATDYKSRIQDEGIRSQDKQELQQGTRTPERTSLIPEHGENPAAKRLREAKAQRRGAADELGEGPGEGSGEGLGEEPAAEPAAEPAQRSASAGRGQSTQE